MNTEVSIAEIFRRPSAFLPIVMSLIAVTLVGIHISAHGTAAQPDEGSAAHLWQLLMAAQIPIVAFFMIKWASRAPRAALAVFAVQMAAALAALAPVYFLRW